MSLEQVEREREVAGLDLLENTMEYVKLDVHSQPFMDELEEFQQKLIDYRGLCHDVLNGLESSQAGSGANNPGVTDS